MTVNNAKNQYDLPLTGGLGLWIFTIGGGVLMAAAIIVISVVRKKKSNK
ncbi:MAG: GGIII-like transmembrane region-containing protein [Acutalibacteraceae bacterium]